MNVLVLSIFFIVVVLAFLEDIIPAWQKQLALAVICIAMICVSAFKPITTTDASTYEYYFYFNDDPIIEMATEPTYIWLSRLFLSLGWGIEAIFFVYAVLSIPLKSIALWKITPHVFTAMIVYVGIYYPLQDVVQIRCGLATAFLVWALVPLARGQYLPALGLTLIATAFHYSSLAFLPVIMVGNIPVTRRLRILMGISVPAFLLLYIVHIDAFTLIPSSIIEGKLDLYKEMSDAGDWEEYIPYKQLTFLAEIALLYFCLFFYDTIEKYTSYVRILVKILVIEMGCLTMFAAVPVLGGRLHDLFGIFNAITFTCCLYCVKPRYAVRAGITVFALAYYIIQMLDEMYFH